MCAAEIAGTPVNHHSKRIVPKRGNSFTERYPATAKFESHLSIATQRPSLSNS